MRTLRAVFHAHSTWSYDGKWSLFELARFFGRVGADAVFMTEHDTGFDPARWPEFADECRRASTRKCTLVPGIEYSSPDNDIHILTWGIDRFLAQHRPVMETLETVKGLGGVCIFAHPIRRNAFAKFRPEWVRYLDAIELWNRKADGILYGDKALELIRSTGLPATVGCDFHRLRNYYPLSNRFTVEPGQDVATACVRALGAGTTVPLLFGRRLLRADGTPQARLHETLEPIRKRLVRLKNRNR